MLTSLARWLTGDSSSLSSWKLPLNVYSFSGGVSFIALSRPLPGYGQYCGPNWTPGTGVPRDQLDTCCQAHDHCFMRQVPPCTVWNQWNRAACLHCNSGLCDCALAADCNPWDIYYFTCLAAKAVTIAYACSFNDKPGSGKGPYPDPEWRFCPRRDIWM